MPDDEQICQAVAAMLSHVGVRTRALAQPSARYIPRLLSRSTGFFLAGWLIATADALNPIQALLMSPGGGHGAQNIGGYSNAQLDDLAGRLATEVDPVGRAALIAEIMRLYRDDVIHVPLHQQWIAWACATGSRRHSRPTT